MGSKLWICPFCLNRNSLPPHYAQISEHHLPPELSRTASTVEYQLSRHISSPPVFLYLVDTCVDAEELSALKESLMASISLLPRDALIGLITFGTMVHVHELGYAELPKSYVFKGSKDYTNAQLQEMLNLSPTVSSMAPGSQPVQGQQPFVPFGRFFMPVNQVEYTVTSLLNKLPRTLGLLITINALFDLRELLYQLLRLLLSYVSRPKGLVGSFICGWSMYYWTWRYC